MRKTVILIVLASLLAGCASSSRSVRAIRQYEREPADVNAVLDRLADLELCLTLVNRLLLETPYTPGDPWVQQVTLDEASASAIEQELRTSSSVYTNRDLRVPVAKVYALHVERALNANSAVARTTQPKYRNVLAAVGDAGGIGEAVLTQWASMDDKVKQLGQLAIQIEKLEDERSKLGPNASQAAIQQATAKIDAVENQAEALAEQIKSDRQAFLTGLKGLQPGANTNATAEGAQLVADLTAVVSVAARLELEAVSLVPIIGVQLLKAIKDPSKIQAPKADADGVATVNNIVAKALAAPETLVNIAAKLEQQVELLTGLTGLFASVAQLSVSDTPGYAFGESASSQVIGLATDSFYVDFKAGAEAFFFHHQANDEKVESSESNQSFDATGREAHLEYAVQPIVLAAFNFDAGMDLLDIPGFLKLDLGYKTDRVYKSGGDIEESGDALGALGVGGAVSDVLSFGLAVAGVGSRVKIATFTSGEVGLFDESAGEITETAPFQFKYTDVELYYDLFWLVDWDFLKEYFDNFYVSFRYLNYEIPRIVYEFEDSNGDPEVDDYVYLRESEPQNVPTEFYMGGVKFSRGLIGSGSRMLADVGLYFGAGPSSFYFDDPDNVKSKIAAGFVGEGLLGWALSLTSPQSSWHFDLQLVYEAQFILAAFFESNASQSDPDTADSDLGQKATNFGGLDIFHGPKLRMSLSF